MTDFSVTNTVTSTRARAPLSVEALAGPQRRQRKEAIIRGLFFAAAMVSVLISVLIIVSLIREAWTFITQVDWSVTWGETGWFPRRGLYDMPTLLVSSIIVTVVAMLVAGPLGLGAAIYLSEYASRRTRGILKPVLEVLAGVPSVVLGFFALVLHQPPGDREDRAQRLVVDWLHHLGSWPLPVSPYGRCASGVTQAPRPPRSSNE